MYPALDTDEKGKQERFNQENDDLHSNSKYIVTPRQRLAYFCRVLGVCGTRSGEWVGDRAERSAALLDSLYAGHGESLNSSSLETTGLQCLCIPSS